MNTDYRNSFLIPRNTPDSFVTPIENGWRLNIPCGKAHAYRLAQVDDYHGKPRRHLPHQPPWTLSLRARLSDANLPGTWGFGVWNDPFGLSLGLGAEALRLPALPQTAWFMHASPPNWLSLRDDPSFGPGQAVPANGFFAGTFCSPRIPSYLFLPGLPAIPLMAIRPISRLLRRLAGRMIRQDGVRVNLDVSQWHDYSIQWLRNSCTFNVDGTEILSTACSPHPPLGLVIWIDNQYAAWTRDGRYTYGTLENPAAWLEIANLTIQ